MTDSDLRGFFMIPSGVIVVDGNYRAMSQALGTEGAEYTFAGGPWAVRRGMEIPDDVLDMTLTHFHERSHYRQLMSTPLGLLLWRVQNVISTEVNFLAHHVTFLQPSVGAKFPLDRWLLSEGGLERCRAALSQGATIAPPIQPVSGYRSEGFTRYMRRVIYEMHLAEHFFEAVTGRPGIAAGEFVELANAAFPLLNVRSDLRVEAVWSTQLPPEAPLVMDGLFSGKEIIEAAARLVEHRVLETLRVPPRRFANWQNTRLHGPYRPAYDYLLGELGDVEAALAVVDAAFMAPIDPAFAAAAGGDLRVEEVLPSYRLPRLVEAAKHLYWPRDPSRRDALLARDLAEAAGLVASERIANVGASAPYSGPRSWDAAARKHDPETRVGLAFEIAQEDIRRAMRKRLDRPSSMLEEGASDPIQPVIQFFNDGASLGSAAFGEEGGLEDWIEKVILCYQKYVHDGLCNALIGAFDVGHLLMNEASLLDRIAESGASEEGDPLAFMTEHLSEDQIRQVFGVRENALQLISEEYLPLLGL